MRPFRCVTLFSSLALLAACQDQIVTPEAGAPPVVAPEEAGPRETMTVGSRWPNGVLYYEYGAGVDQATVNLIERAVAHYNSMTTQTGVSIARGTNGGRYVRILPTTGTPRVSAIGYTGGVQDLYFKGTSWWQVAVHEFGHALGQYHEHQRPERDAFITVTTAGQSIGDIYPIYNLDRPEAYDTWSVMHYSAGEMKSASGTVYATFDSPDFTPLPKSIHMGLVATDMRSLARMYRGAPNAARLVSVWGTGMCLDTPWQDNNGDGRLDSGSPVFINNCNPTEHQQVTYSPDTGHMTFSIGGVTRCLASRSDVLGGNEQLIADLCQDVSRQKWFFNQNGDRRIRRRAHGDARGACADVNAGYGKQVKAPVILQYCHTVVENGANQTWFRG